ncbi:MAG TPA: DNA/RNA nuclease SfsA [Sedimenticola sp.]|nr:DNA/RNA nuclease SfsA [Sedimenticola sp.]
MQLPPLTNGTILRRYKRFLADVELEDGSVVSAHCPNTGAMTGCWEPGAPVQLSHSDNPRRKLAWTLERVDMGRGWIGVNTMRANPVIAEAVASGGIPPLSGYGALRREVRLKSSGHPRSRLDLHLSDGPGADAFVEIKNVTLLDGDRLCFPDAVSERGRRHLDLLLEAVRLGCRGVILFALNRPEGRCFSPAREIDPAYARRLEEVVGQGVEALAVRIRHTDEGMEVGGMVEVVRP